MSYPVLENILEWINWLHVHMQRLFRMITVGIFNIFFICLSFYFFNPTFMLTGKYSQLYCKASNSLSNLASFWYCTTYWISKIWQLQAHGDTPPYSCSNNINMKLQHIMNYSTKYSSAQFIHNNSLTFSMTFP